MGVARALEARSRAGFVGRAASAVLAFLGMLACDRGDPAPQAAGEPPASAPQRIVPASATAVDLVAALVVPQRIAAFPEQALEYSRIHDLAPELARTPRFSAYVAENLLVLGPDLVVIEPFQSPDTTQRLRATGIRVLVLPEVRDWSDARASIELVGREVGEPGAAQALIADLDRRVEGLRTRAEARPKLRGLCYSNFGGAGSTSGSGTTQHAMFELSGLRNLVAERGTAGSVGMTFEELLALDPEVIVVSEPLKMPEGPTGDRGGASEKLLMSEPTLAGLRAVRERRIVRLPAWLFATGSYELVHGAEVLSAELDALLERLGAASGDGR
jgi:iron complex transport system substrate-binding protein